MPASPSPGTRTLDLAAMALTPVDLDDIGLTGFGQQTSMFLDLRGAGRATCRCGGWPRYGYGSCGLGPQRGRVPTPLPATAWSAFPSWSLSSQLRTFVTPYVIEYASVEGAAAGFALLETEAADVGMKDVLGTRTIGDRSEITRFRRSTDNGELYRALDLTFQIDNLVAGVTLGEFGGREPDLATVESLGELLLVKIRRGQAEGGLGLSNVVLRLAVQTSRPAPTSMAAWTGRPCATTVRRRTSSSIAPSATATPSWSMVWAEYRPRQPGAERRYPLRSLALPVRQRAGAAGWLESVERAEQSPNIIEAIPVAGTATIGDASETLAVASSGAERNRARLPDRDSARGTDGTGPDTRNPRRRWLPSKRWHGLRWPACRLAPAPARRCRQVSRSPRRLSPHPGREDPRTRRNPAR